MEFPSRHAPIEQKDLSKPQVPDVENPQGTLSVRRNPPRKARRTPATDHHKPSRYAQPTATSVAADRVPPFPTDELMEAGSLPHPRTLSKPSETGSESSENLKVFLRIRPLEIKAKPSRKPSKGNGKSRANAASPNGGGMKNGICLVANDSGSVTLTAPPSSLDSKRGKSEVFDGFSFVFPAESQQKDVYERALEPLVVDFLEGKSGLLAAMGPTGSGKTHTMFGCPREPGIVHLALKQIFCHESENVTADPHKLRSYYVSIFEIYSDRGKAEKVFDLSSGETDLSFQQSTIKGLQEVMVSNISEAECIIARGMLKRMTAMTNANCQSSRSQCVINIRYEPKILQDEGEISNGSVLTIVDLAGAERERKTGNQGARLVESNFINNTSMVFSLCLRSLLEHQKNPRRPLQKHFQNSLLTRYLRDYMEGRKRMTLILTVKPGEDDYHDSSFLLRQASPYMRIKFNSVEEARNPFTQKRCNFPLTKLEHPKRRKCTADSLIFPVAGTKGCKDGCPSSEKASSETVELSDAISETALLDKLERVKSDNQVLQNFSKALWNVLKQYKKKLEVSENDVENLRRKLWEEEARFLELMKQLEDLKSHHYSCCSHCVQPLTIWQLQRYKEKGKGDTLIDPLGISSLSHVSAMNVEILPVDMTLMTEDKKRSERVEPTFECKNLEKLDFRVDGMSPNASFKGNAYLDSLENPVQSTSLNDGESMLSSSVERRTALKEEETPRTMRLALHWKSNYKSQSGSGCQDQKGQEEITIREMSSMTDFAGVDNSMHHSSEKQRTTPSKTPISQDSVSLVEDGLTGRCEAIKLPGKENCISAPKTSDLQKPRRRLLPTSVMLLKELNGFDMENENPKGSKCSERLEVTEQRERSQGSISLFHLLRRNIHQ